MILSSDKNSECSLSSFFALKKPRRIEHLQSEETFSSDPYFSWCTCNFNFFETCYSVFSVLFIRECFNYIFSSFWHAPISCSNIISFLSAFSVCSCVRKGNYCCKEAICSESNSPNSLSPIESICKTSLQLSPYSVGL